MKIWEWIRINITVSSICNENFEGNSENIECSILQIVCWCAWWICSGSRSVHSMANCLSHHGQNIAVEHPDSTEIYSRACDSVFVLRRQKMYIFIMLFVIKLIIKQLCHIVMDRMSSSTGGGMETDTSPSTPIRSGSEPVLWCLLFYLWCFSLDVNGTLVDLLVIFAQTHGTYIFCLFHVSVINNGRPRCPFVCIVI